MFSTIRIRRCGNVENIDLLRLCTHGTMEYTIRLATTEDVGSLAAIEQSIFNDARSEKTFHSSIKFDDNAVAIVAETDGEIIAYADVYQALDELQLNNIAVVRPYRGRHIAEKMLNVIIDTGREAGCVAITLEVRESNIPAIRLYEKCGFVEVGRREGYYLDNNEAAILMDKTIETGKRIKKENNLS